MWKKTWTLNDELEDLRPQKNEYEDNEELIRTLQKVTTEQTQDIEKLQTIYYSALEQNNQLSKDLQKAVELAGRNGSLRIASQEHEIRMRRLESELDVLRQLQQKQQEQQQQVIVSWSAASPAFEETSRPQFPTQLPATLRKRPNSGGDTEAGVASDHKRQRRETDHAAVFSLFETAVTKLVNLASLPDTIVLVRRLTGFAINQNLTESALEDELQHCFQDLSNTSKYTIVEIMANWGPLRPEKSSHLPFKLWYAWYTGEHKLIRKPQ